LTAETIDWNTRTVDPAKRHKTGRDLLLVCGNLVVLESAESENLSFFVHKSV